MDNIDHNRSSETSKGSFHGTGISIFQPILSLDEGIERTFETGGFTSGTDKVLQELLHVDTNISFSIEIHRHNRIYSEILMKQINNL